MPHVRPSPLPVHRHGMSLLDLHLAIDHRLRAPHLRTTSQEKCCTTQLTPWLVHKLNPRRQLIDNHSSQNRTTRARIKLVFAYIKGFCTQLSSHASTLKVKITCWWFLSYLVLSTKCKHGDELRNWSMIYSWFPGRSWCKEPDEVHGHIAKSLNKDTSAR